jgi:hypothetical protein
VKKRQTESGKPPTRKGRIGPGDRPTRKRQIGSDDWPLKDRRIEAIRQLAVDIAVRNHGPGMVLICNPATEPSPLPPTELLHDRCAWCGIAIYYDRKMPSPADITRTCIACGLLLLEAEKKGHN